MRVITARNVGQAIPEAERILAREGIERQSRNGPVLMLDEPVATVYKRPWERVVFWPERDANPFFHLYEALWMLAGREDVAPLARYTKQILEYSDDGKTLHDAYGYRWRHHFDSGHGIDLDQVTIIAENLASDHNDRRCVLQMWDPTQDLGVDFKAVPCNLTATFQVNSKGFLELTVFCRSNDVVWGAYGANAVHFSMLHEYVSQLIKVPMGRYTQISVNWHAYRSTFEKLRTAQTDCPYSAGRVEHVPMDAGDQMFRKRLEDFLAWENFGEPFPRIPLWANLDPWWHMVHAVIGAHMTRRATPDIITGTDDALEYLRKYSAVSQTADWVVAAIEWLERRKASYEIRRARSHETLGWG